MSEALATAVLIAAWPALMLAHWYGPRRWREVVAALLGCDDRECRK